MPYQLVKILKLGPAYSGLALKVQLVDTTLTNVGLAITAGITEISAGNYAFNYASYPDGFRGYGNVLKSDGTYLDSFSVNPQEGEYVDEKVSSAGGGGSTINVGSVVVDWNYNANDFRVLRSGVGVRGIQVFAYVSSDYGTNPNTAPVRGYAVSNDAGQWFGMKLSSTVQYTIVADPNDGTAPVMGSLTV